MHRPLSGIQREALALYRRALRMVRTKPPATRDHFLALVRSHFRTQAHAVSPRNVSAVEYLMRRTQRTLEGWEDDGVRDVGVTPDMTTGRRK
ncbi:hypothetical protein EXIGLDRAFT_725819 [Exidia glandulosa HHB12029]|uniref:Complex 1 LYR protein domain-containing protein n=1 Tax=Exidia glandulosa HHB12029 TaxID=1314781 RepID=A0A165QBV9_EXIGL|nr:hypothetical protein EXIGLDRAFT_725819 [Exidia glandulosa HHB12029]